MVKLTLKAQARLLYAASAAIMFASAATLVWGLAPTHTVSTPPSAASSGTVTSRTPTTQLDRSKLLALCQTDLRKPLVDGPAAPAAPAAAQPPAAFAGRLLATMVEPRNPQAMVQSGKRTKLISVGDVIDGATLLEIADGSAKFRIGAQTVTVKVEERRPAAEKGRKTP